MIGGMKGYERLLSLSKDTGNPRWKPLHMFRKFNSKNRRLAQLRSKGSWFKGRMEGAQEDGNNGIEDSSQTVDLVSKMGKKANAQLSSNHDGVAKETSRRRESGSPRKGIKRRRRGLKREIITLGGQKKQETSIRRKLKRKMNQQRGKAGIPATRKNRVTTLLQDSPISVLFIDNTKG